MKVTENQVGSQIYNLLKKEGVPLRDLLTDIYKVFNEIINGYDFDLRYNGLTLLEMAMQPTYVNRKSRLADLEDISIIPRLFIGWGAPVSTEAIELFSEHLFAVIHLDSDVTDALLSQRVNFNYKNDEGVSLGEKAKYIGGSFTKLMKLYQQGLKLSHDDLKNFNICLKDLTLCIKYLNPCDLNIKLEFLGHILSWKDKNGEYKYNINSKNHLGERLIDVAPIGRLFTESESLFMLKEKATEESILQFLRKRGSTEPQNSINKGLSKLIINDGKGNPPDLIEGNIPKTEALLRHMAKSYPLSDAEITQEIKDFEQSRDFTTYPAQWHKGFNVQGVIEALSEMTDTNDRLSMHWNFKTVLGTLIHMAKNNEDMIDRLISTLSAIEKCNLSKLINLLFVCQDELCKSQDLIDYNKVDFDAFTQVIDKVTEKISSTFGEKAPLAIFKWFVDNTNSKEIDDPAKWCSYTTDINGMFNKAFMNHPQFKVNCESYHFTDGLRMICINNLVEKLLPPHTPSKQYKFISTWQESIREGSIQWVEEVCQKIIDGAIKIENCDTILELINTFSGNLEHLPVDMVKHYHTAISKQCGQAKGKSFLEKLLNSCFLSDEVEGYIKKDLQNSSAAEEYEIGLNGEYPKVEGDL